jgi:hypothetical protein
MMSVSCRERNQPNPKWTSASSYTRREIDLPCDECGELHTHQFRSLDDLLHAIRLATLEVDRGVLSRILVEKLSGAEHEALESAFASNALPGVVRYRFKCTVCGDRFELVADTADGSGGWTREGEAA